MSEGKKNMLKLLHALSLADHTGDVNEDIEYIAKQMGIEVEWHDEYDSYTESISDAAGGLEGGEMYNDNMKKWLSEL